MNVFVIKSMVPDIDFTTIFKGVLPFVAALIFALIVIVVFPQMATWLPSRM
jgi:C4-dicarboxylate transporter DctM subunit